MKHSDLKELLDEKALRYNSTEFIESDPIQIPYLFTKKEDIEISGFLAATIAWGQRPTMMTNACRLVEVMDFASYYFILNHTSKGFQRGDGLVYHTANDDDVLYFITSLRNNHSRDNSFETYFPTRAG